MKKMIKNICNMVSRKSIMLRHKLAEQRAEGYVDTAGASVRA